jgi:DNA-directed RNA polymerase subunit alpha
MARKNLLKGFKRPKGIIFDQTEDKPFYGKFTAYPFERGYGVTIGNTLRRILLSSIQGYAISAIRITYYDDEQVPHVISSEYESIPEVVEDTPELINNLKQIQLRLSDDLETETINVVLKGPNDFLAKELEVGGNVQVIN